MAESMGGDVWSQVLQAVQGLSEQVNGLRGEVMELRDRMDKQQVWMQRLGFEFTDTRDEVKQLRQGLRAGLQTELQLGIRQMHDRIDRNNDALLLMVSGLDRNTAERFKPMEHRLHALEAR